MGITPELKIAYFEYVLKRLLEWNEVATGGDENDLSLLKSLKLLFLVSVASAVDRSPSILLEEVFDDFRAMPYGHVESQIYDAIKSRNGQLEHYIIDNNTTIRTQEWGEEIYSLSIDILASIDRSIEYLQNTNFDLVILPQFDLVNLSHAYYSWQHYYTLARKQGIYSYSIPSEVIRKEDKIFNLNVNY